MCKSDESISHQNEHAACQYNRKQKLHKPSFKQDKIEQFKLLLLLCNCLHIPSRTEVSLQVISY